LEGLTINYFIRNTNFADTLLQMGRWFGYRPGYIDCCKLFSTADSLEKFDQTTYTMEDLEQKFIDMNRDPENTPAKYALLVLKHPGTLKITRPSILKNTKEVNWSLADFLLAAILLFGVVFLCELVFTYIHNTQKRFFICLGILFLLFVLWAELAVGIFNSPIAGS
ncbi:MAG: hypothetical protein EOO43_15400, partial [Flavobacterium sp.]